jgi:hypothetical protein
MNETYSDDVTWYNKLEANTVDGEQQKTRGSENETETNSDGLA